MFTLSYNVLRYAPLAFANRLWKWLTNSPPIYRTVLGTVLEQLLRKTVLTAYGNGWQSSSPHLWNCLGNCVLLPVQLCLTVWATVSYCLYNCVLLFVQLCLTACGNG
jgi:hypothetical protein